MAKDNHKRKILVYADWNDIDEPILMGLDFLGMGMGWLGELFDNFLTCPKKSLQI